MNYRVDTIKCQRFLERAAAPLEPLVPALRGIGMPLNGPADLAGIYSESFKPFLLLGKHLSLAPAPDSTSFRPSPACFVPLLHAALADAAPPLLRRIHGVFSTVDAIPPSKHKTRIQNTIGEMYRGALAMACALSFAGCGEIADPSPLTAGLLPLEPTYVQAHPLTYAALPPKVQYRIRSAFDCDAEDPIAAEVTDQIGAYAMLCSLWGDCFGNLVGAMVMCDLQNRQALASCTDSLIFLLQTTVQDRHLLLWSLRRRPTIEEDIEIAIKKAQTFLMEEGQPVPEAFTLWRDAIEHPAVSIHP